ncbi:MAG: efflux RND transporter permease subunit [bacterium]
MRDTIIRFFLKRHLLANLIFISVFVGGIIAWNQIPKEQLPDITFDTLRISVRYPGASAEEVEYYATRPIEEAIRGMDGVYSIRSQTGGGSCSITVEIENNYSDKEGAITDIRNAVLDVKLPADILDDPKVGVFKTSRMAVLDIGLFLEGEHLLDEQSREILQTYALALENRLLSLSEVSSVGRSGYLKDELQIKVDPKKLVSYRIPFNKVIREIQNNNVRQPVGSIENIKEPKVTLYGELRSVDDLRELSIQGSFEGQVLRLKDVADVDRGYEKSNTVLKINAHEGVFLNVVKSSQTGIIDAVKAVNRVVADFSNGERSKGKIRIVSLDDESVDVKNRISIIGLNGTIGFILVVLALFVFLDFRSGIWVALGIPFTFCFSLIAALLVGYSINNITLAAVIIVMGMVVDDAIVVSENISRLRACGVREEEAALKGTSYVFLPIIASILTTCVAFVPLLFFAGRFGVMIKFIPPIVVFMLGGSLLEALFILPGHMILPLGNSLNNLFRAKAAYNGSGVKKHWFDRWEDKYGRFIEKILPWKWAVFVLFGVLLVGAGYIASSSMKFVMFPDEETGQINFSAEAPEGATRYETADLAQPVEDMLAGYIGKEVVGFRNQIARTRRGSASQENRMRMSIEIVSREERVKSADELISEWTEKIKSFENISDVRFSKSWHGQSGGSPIEILVKENNDILRKEIAEELAGFMRKHSALMNVEVDQPRFLSEYRIGFDRDKIRRLGISPSDIGRTLRAALEGTVLYDFVEDDEEIEVRLSTVKDARDDIDKVLQIPVENDRSYLVPLKDIVTVESVSKPDSIVREDMKRVTSVDADLRPGSGQTPLDVARYFEAEVFRKILSRYPSAILEFGGEVKDTRESRKNFMVAIVMTIVLIYMILVLLFNSLYKPLLIMITIPFSVVGIILAFWIHGISMYGFFAVIGALGLAGVVVNDAIIMLVKLDSDFDASLGPQQLHSQVSNLAKTRLRAVVLTTLTTVVAIIPTAYGWAGYDSMLAQMMLALAWGLFFGTMITLLLIPCTYTLIKQRRYRKSRVKGNMASRVTVIIAICFASLLFSSRICAEEPGSVSVSLDSFISQVCEKDEVFQEILIDELTLQYRRALTLEAKDIILGVRSQYDFIIDGDDADSSNTVSLGKLFPYTGTDISAEYQSSFSAVSGSVTSEFGVSVSQPIARNAFGGTNRLLDSIVGMEIDIASHQVVEAYEDYLATLIQLYYNWYSSYENLRTAEASYRESEKLLKNIKEKSKSNIALPIDVNKVKLQVIAKKESVILQKSQYEEYRNMAEQALRYGGDEELIPQVSSLYAGTVINFADDYENFKNKSRTALILKMLGEKSKLEVEKNADALLPSIDLFASYSMEGSGHWVEDNDKLASVGATLDWPIPGSASRARHKTAKLESEKTLLSKKSSIIRLYTDLKNLNAQIEREKQLIALADEKISLAQAVVEDEKENYSVARATLNDLIDEINKLEQNKFNKISHEIQLKKLVIEWLRMTDVLISKEDIAGRHE